jgi:hypothetical protein
MNMATYGNYTNQFRMEPEGKIFGVHWLTHVCTGFCQDSGKILLCLDQLVGIMGKISQPNWCEGTGHSAEH